MSERHPIVLLSHAREVGGAELHLERLIQYLVTASGQPVVLVCRPDHVLDAWAARIGAAGVRVHRLELSRPSGARGLLRVLRGARLVHIHLAHPVGKYQLTAALLARLLRRPAVVTHHLVLEPGQIPLRGAGKELWLRAFRLYRRLDRHVAISAHGREMLTRRYRFDPARTSVIYNGTDPDRFFPATPEDRAALAGRLLSELISSPAGAGPLICTVARLSPQKGIDDLIQAARTLIGDFPAARYVVLGEGERRPALESALSTAGLKRVFFLAGARPPDQVAQWLRAADLFVLPSHYEGGPAMALMEAMASGGAAIATRVNGTAELIDSAEVGCLVPPRRPDALAAAIAELLNDTPRRLRVGQRARQRVVAFFDIRDSHRRTLELYRGLLGGA